MSERPASLHVNTERHWRGGEQQVLHLLEGLRSHGVRAELVAQPGSPLAERAAAAAIAVHPVPMRGEWDLPAAIRIARIARAGRFSIIHLHTSRAHGLGRIASILAPGPRVIVARRVIFPPRGRVNRWLKYLHGIDNYVAISYAVRDTLTAAGVPGDRIAVVPSGVDCDRFAGAAPAGLRASCGLPASARLVGTVGHLEHGKGQQDLIGAAALLARELPDLFFVLVGEGAGRAAFEQQAASLGIGGRVIFTGFRSDVPAVLADLDLFVMPSHAEGLCTAAVEAMAAGLPVIGTAVGGLVEVVADGQTGLLVPPANPEALADAIRRVMTDESSRRRMAAAARARAFDHFGVKNMVELTIRVYENALQPQAPA